MVDDNFAPPITPERRLDHSTPHGLFALQVWRTGERLQHDTIMKVNGKPRTLPFDPTMDFQANAENIVRDDWIRMGIWQNAWGRGWPKRSKPALNRPWIPRGVLFTGGPSVPVNAQWAHETENLPPRRVASLPRRLSTDAEPFGPMYGKDKQPLVQPQPVVPKKRDGKKTVTERRIDAEEEERFRVENVLIINNWIDPARSRPNYQFYAQLAHEVEWARDGMRYNWPDHRPTDAQLRAIAGQNIKVAWIVDGIWNPKWGDVPGMTWMHEDKYDSDSSTSSSSESGLSAIEERTEPNSETGTAPEPGLAAYEYRRKGPVFISLLTDSSSDDEQAEKNAVKKDPVVISLLTDSSDDGQPKKKPIKKKPVVIDLLTDSSSDDATAAAPPVAAKESLKRKKAPSRLDDSDSDDAFVPAQMRRSWRNVVPPSVLKRAAAGVGDDDALWKLTAKGKRMKKLG
jgi:hypothetical protein